MAHEMNAGRELDALVAEKVMEWRMEDIYGEPFQVDWCLVPRDWTGGMVPVGECPVCRSLTYPVYSFWHQMLMRLTEKVERVNAIQHSGGSIEAEDWSELHALTNEAKAVLQRTDPLVQAGCRRSHRQKILIQQICDLARENDSERRIDQRDAIIEKLNA